MISRKRTPTLRSLVRSFGLSPTRMKSVPSLYRRHAVIRVRTNDGDFALKPYYPSRLSRVGTIRQIRTTVRWIRRLTRADYEYMPKWLRTSSGRWWTRRGAQPHYMTEWIPGRSPETPEHFELLGRALAALHTVAPGRRGVPSESRTLALIRARQRQDRLYRAQAARAARDDRRFRDWQRAYGEACREMSSRAWAVLEQPQVAELLREERSRPALIHDDITSTNVLIAEDGRLFIIDWDRVKIGSVYSDLAKALANTARFEPELILSTLKGYEAVKPLLPPERRIVAALFRLPREAWIAACTKHRSKRAELLGLLSDTWEQRLKAIETIEAWANATETGTETGTETETETANANA